MKKKKTKIILLVVILLVVAGEVTTFILLRGKGKKDDKNKVYVESVAEITGTGVYGYDRYMGIVEAQETKGVEKAGDRTVKEVYVKKGDVVKKGDKLFSYDTEEMELKLQQLKLELSNIYANVNYYNQQIASLKEEKELVPDENKMEYTAQIQSIQADLNQANYDAQEKQLEIDRQSAALEGVDVVAPMDGVIKEVKDSNGNSDSMGYNDYYGDGGDSSSNAFITIMALGDYRIKGTVDEMNARMLSQGQPVIVRSRIDETIMYNGTISKVDLENPITSNNNYYGEGGNATSKYAFYVDIEGDSSLLLGEHVYIEPDCGQGQTSDILSMYDFYFMWEDDNAYVWLEKDGEIKKQKVELGEYNEETMMYEVLSGFSADDYIAFPMEGIKEGMSTTHNFEESIMMENVMDIEEDGLMMEDEYFEEDGLMMEDEYFEDDGLMMEDEYIDEDGIMYENEEGIDDLMIDDSVVTDDEEQAIEGGTDEDVSREGDD